MCAACLLSLPPLPLHNFVDINSILSWSILGRFLVFSLFTWSIPLAWRSSLVVFSLGRQSSHLAHLIRKGLWFNIIEVNSDPLEGTTDVAEWHEKQMKKWKKLKMEKARAEIVLKVEDPQLVHMRSCNLYEIMEVLKRVHIARGLGMRMSLCRRFWNMEKKEDELMANWVSHVKALVWKLEAIGVEVTEEDTIWRLRMVWMTLLNLSSSRSTLPLRSTLTSVYSRLHG